MKKFTLIISVLITVTTIGQSLEGVWKLKPVAGAMGVGPTQGDIGWWNNGAGDVTTRACLFDDEYVFNADGTFQNVMQAQTWVEAWQDGQGDGCRTPVSPHNGSNSSTWAYNSGTSTLTLNGLGAHIGLSKVTNSGEITNPANAASSINYIISNLTATEMTVDVNFGAGWWRYLLQKNVATSPLEGTWRLKPVAGAMGVGPTQGDIGWWNNGAGDVTTRACLFDDEYVFNADGTFQNVMQAQTWVETWQDGQGDGCRTPVSPHNGSNSSTWAYNSGTSTLTLNGLGAHIGLSKVTNSGEITNPANAASSINYIISNLTATEMTVDVNFGAGWWRYLLTNETTPPAPSGPTVAAPTPPARPTADVISVFSDAYANVNVTTWGPDWGPSSSMILDNPIEGNATKRIDMTAGKTFAGIVLETYHDLSSFTHFHVDYWIADPVQAGQVLSFKLSNHASQSGETSAIESTPTPTGGSWQSVDVELSSFSIAGGGSAARNSIKEIVISGARANNNVPLYVYFDNLYFHKGTLGTISNELAKFNMYPNPANDVLNITAQSTINNVSIYNLLGQEVLSTSPNELQISLDVNNLNAGIYIVKATIDGVETSSKFIKK